jgi:hypothetical protein
MGTLPARLDALKTAPEPDVPSEAPRERARFEL